MASARAAIDAGSGIAPSPSEKAPSSIGMAAGGTSSALPFSRPAESSASRRFASAEVRRRYSPSPNGTNSPLRLRNAAMSSAIVSIRPVSSRNSPLTENQKSTPPVAASFHAPGFGAAIAIFRPFRHSRRTASPRSFSAASAFSAWTSESMRHAPSPSAHDSNSASASRTRPAAAFSAARSRTRTADARLCATRRSGCPAPGTNSRSASASGFTWSESERTSSSHSMRISGTGSPGMRARSAPPPTADSSPWIGASSPMRGRSGRIASTPSFGISIVPVLPNDLNTSIAASAALGKA